MFTFHAIDAITGKLYDKECLNADELDSFMIKAESKYNACQVVEDLTGKRVVYTVNAEGKFEVHSKHAGYL